MGNAPSSPVQVDLPEEVIKPPQRILTETDNDELDIPELQQKQQDPRLILLTALLRIAKSADPNYDVKELYKYFKRNEKHMPCKTLSAGELVFKKGQKPDGVYVVVTGELSVLASLKKDEVMRIFRKDFVFDVEIVYDMKSLYTVKAFTECTVYVVPNDQIQELIKDMQRPHIQYWYIRRRLPPNHPKLTPKVVYNKICISVMKQVPLFADWSDETIQAFIEYMGDTPMVLYRSKTALIQQGDDGGDMLILVRGRVDAYERRNKLLSYFAQNIPLVFGEEGVFNEKWKHKITVIADSPCYAIIINKHWLWHASEHVWEFAEGAEPHWTEAVQKWWNVLDCRDGDLTQNSAFSPYLTVEVIYQWLKCTDSFKDCATRYIYELAKCGTPVIVPKEGFFEFDNLEQGCLLVLKGQLELLDIDQMNGIPKLKKKEPSNEDENNTKGKKQENSRNTDKVNSSSNTQTAVQTDMSKQEGVENEEEEEMEEEDPTLYNSQDLVYYKQTEEKLYLKANIECLLIKFSLQDIMNEMSRVHVDSQPVGFLQGVVNKLQVNNITKL